MTVEDQVRLNLAYHSARILYESILCGETGGDEFEQLAYNLALDLAILSENTENFEKFVQNDGNNLPVSMAV